MKNKPPSLDQKVNERSLFVVLISFFYSLGFSLSIHAQTANVELLNQAKRMHDRLAGVPPSEAVLAEMYSELEAGDAIAAANTAMENDNFYNVTLKNWAAPWTNRDMNVFVPLDDYIATIIGAVRDSDGADRIDYRQVLYGDLLYTASDSLGLTPYSLSNNRHYEELEQSGASLKNNLVRRSQAAVTGLPVSASAGVISTRSAAKAFFIAGTNRAQFRFTLLNHLCIDLEQLQDNTRIPDRIRQDVSRSPGGDSRVFLNNCVSCHAGMDPMAQAFAYYDYTFDSESDPTGENGEIVYTDGVVQSKYFNNDTTFPAGFVTPDDSWANYWREGINANLGWDSSLPGSGVGASSMLQELAHSQQFAKCAVRKTFKTVCLREPADAADISQVNQMVADFTQPFASGGYNIKMMFAQAADYCKGQ